MTYTLDYLRGDTKGEAKQEAGPEIHSVAAKKGDLYDKFRRVCRDNGIDPERSITDMVFKVMNDEGFAEEAMATDPHVDDLRTPEEQKKDLEFLLELREEYDLQKDTGMDIDVEGLVEDRLQASVGNPLDKLDPSAGGNSGGGSSNGQIAEVLDRMEKRLESLENQVEDGAEIEFEEKNTEESRSGEDRRRNKVEEIKSLAEDNDDGEISGDDDAGNSDGEQGDVAEGIDKEGSQEGSGESGGSGSVNGDDANDTVEVGDEGESEEESDAGAEMEQFGGTARDSDQSDEEEFDGPLFGPEDGEVSDDE